MGYKEAIEMYKLNDEKMFYDVADGVAVIIDFTTGIYYGFNSFGTAVIDCLMAGADEEKIASALSGKPGCPADIRKTVDDFAKKLKEKEILLTAEGTPAEAEVNEELLKEGFVPEFDEFSEVQDLIMADPIHEVDAEQGWPTVK